MPRKQYSILVGCLIAAACTLADAAEEPCDGKDYRAFDFAIGKWQITSDSGKNLGSIEVNSVLNGCAIEEHWHAPGRVSGRSLNVFSGDGRVWRQLYADDSGVSLSLVGVATSGAIVLETVHGADSDGFFRYSWVPQPDGTLIQSGDHCASGAASCKTIFSNRWTRHEPDKGT